MSLRTVQPSVDNDANAYEHGDAVARAGLSATLPSLWVQPQ